MQKNGSCSWASAPPSPMKAMAWSVNSTVT